MVFLGTWLYVITDLALLLYMTFFMQKHLRNDHIHFTSLIILVYQPF